MNEVPKINNWRDVVILFFQEKINTSSLAKACKYIEDKTINLEKETNKKKKVRLTESIEKKKLELNDLKNNPVEIVEWLDKNTTKNIEAGSRIIKTTHPLKFSHSSAPNDGVLVDYEDHAYLLTTACIPNDYKTFDMAHNNGALISISRFLALSFNGTSIYDLILEADFCFLEGFYKKREQLEVWKSGLINLVETRNIKSASFAKQVYFPVSNANYHLLAPLTASTLAESIFTKVTNFKYQKKYDYFKGDGCLKPRFILPKAKSAVVRIGGNNPQNVSMLNRGRNFKLYNDSKNSFGVFYTVSSEPPVWQSQLKAPIYRTNFFYELSNNYDVKENIQYLSDFLTRFESLQLSIKDPKRMRWVEQWIENVTDEVLYYVKTIQALPIGWSATENIKLKPAHRVLLDIYRQDEDFLAIKNGSAWQNVIIQDFAAWLNYQLSQFNKKFTPQEFHTKLWMKIFKVNFREEFDAKELSQKEQTA